MPYIGAAYLVQLDDPVTNVTSMTNAALKLGRDSQNLVDFSTDDVIILRAANANQIQLQDGAFIPVADSDVDLGTTGVRWKDAFVDSITVTGEVDAVTLDISGNADIDGTLEADAITINGTAIGSIYGVVAGSTSIVTVGALDTGSITSGFTSIDVGAGAITTTGLISGGSLDIDDVLINGTTIGHTNDTDLITLADGAVTIAGTIGSGAITSTAGLTGTQVDILAQGDLRLQDSSGGQYVALQAHATTTQSYTLTFPAAVAASAGQYLSSATDGTLSWATASSGVGLGMVLALG